MEDLLTDLMFSVPSEYTVEKVIITADTVNKEQNRRLSIIRNVNPLKLRSLLQGSAGVKIPRHNYYRIMAVAAW